MTESADDPRLALELIEMVLHDGLRALETTWQEADEGRDPAGGITDWRGERDRLRHETRQVVLYALVVGDVSFEEVAEIAARLQAQGLSDPLAEELQQPGLEALAAEFRGRIAAD